jgi:hypothetical protein
VTDFQRRAAGAAGGAAVGTLAYWLLLSWGIHLLAAVGAATALGVSSMTRSSSLGWGVFTMVLAVVLSLLVEFLFRPFAVDPSFAYFAAHLADLPRNSIISLAVVAALGFYFGRGRVGSPQPEKRS